MNKKKITKYRVKRVGFASCIIHNRKEDAEKEARNLETMTGLRHTIQVLKNQDSPLNEK